jgi:RNA polymerase sigma-70 factor (ECF subfamily)
LSRIDAASSSFPAARYNDDRLLVDRLVRGDATAWRDFVETHGRLVRARVADVASAFGRTNDESAIDDATAEVFAALLGNDAAALRAFAGRSSLGTYVAVIATRSATRGFARRQMMAPPAQDLELARAACDQTMADPVHELIEVEQQKKLRLLLQRLSPKQRDVITLFHLQGKSYVQISRQLDMPIGSIGPTLRRAEARLRQWMEYD